MPKTAPARAAPAETQRRKLLRLRRRHWDVARIAEALRVPVATVVAVTRDFDRAGLALDADQIDTVLDLRDQGSTYLTIAARTGWPQRAIFAVLERSETLAPVATRLTDVLTPQQIERVRSLRRRGVSVLEVARQLRVPVARLRAALPPELRCIERAPLPARVRNKVLTLRRAGQSVATIARTLAVSPYQVRAALPPELRRLRLEPRLPEALQRRIQALRRRELSYAEIARRTGVSLWAVRCALPPELRGRDAVLKTRRARRDRLAQRVIALRRKGLIYAEIAQQVGFSTEWVRRVLPLELRGPPREPPPPETVARIVALRESGASFNRIVRDTGVSLYRVRRALPPALLAPRRRPPLSPAQRRLLRTLRAQGASYATLARLLETSVPQVRAATPPELRFIQRRGAPLTPALHARILALRAAGHSYPAIAAQTDVSAWRIQRLLPADLRGDLRRKSITEKHKKQ